ncbi:hypothetical protein B0H10DRAFT_526730 [Mycena sp. CBHHK59/15]|nr:hypothetical protein B0H10DRAFT_526730 [Mycena sp. CBHHK59/15]
MKIICNAKCDAVDSSGNKCRGGPIMKPKPQASRGHQYFVGCSGWTTKFRQGHRTHSIPDNVDENLVANAPLQDYRCTATWGSDRSPTPLRHWSCYVLFECSPPSAGGTSELVGDDDLEHV